MTYIRGPMTALRAGGWVFAGLLWAAVVAVVLSTAGSSTAALGAPSIAASARQAPFDAGHSDLAARPDLPVQLPKVQASVPTGMIPTAAAVDPTTGWVYVANSFGDSVTVINGTTVVGTIDLAPNETSDPVAVVYDPIHGTIDVVDQLDLENPFGALTVIRGLVVQGFVYVGDRPTSATVDPTDGWVYVTNAGDGTVSVVNGTLLQGTVHVGRVPNTGAYDPADGLIYVANSRSGNVSLLAGTAVVGSVPTGPGSDAVAYDPLDQEVYVANNGTATVTVVLGSAALGTVGVGADPTYAVYNPTVGGVEVANTNSSNLSVLNGPAVVGGAPVAAGPVWAGEGTSGDFTFVAGQGANQLTVLNGTSFVETLAAGALPTVGVADAFNGLVYVVNLGSNNVSVIGLATPTYAVTFDETGLPAGTNWSVTFDAETSTTSTSTLSFTATPGSYGYSVAPPSGFAVVTSSPPSPVTVSDASVTVQVTFAPVSTPSNYTVTFVETGLPNPCSASSGSSGGAAVAALAWGHSGSSGSGCCSSGASAGGAWGHSSGNGSGACCGASGSSSWAVSSDGQGGSQGQCCGASQAPQGLGHNGPTSPCCRGGSSSALVWSVTLGGVTRTTSNTSLTFVEPDGVYNYTIGAPSGYTVSGSVPASPVTVDGANVTVNVTFAKGCGAHTSSLSVTFVESGLARGTTWCVTLGTTVCSSGNEIAFANLTSGSYGFTVGNVAGYTVTPASGTVTLTNRSATVSVSFSGGRSHGCGG